MQVWLEHTVTRKVKYIFNVIENILHLFGCTIKN